MLYQGSEGSSTPGKLVSPWRKVNVLAIYSESDHEYRLSDPTAVVHNADWLDLNTFSPVKDALSRTRRLINTRKKWFHREGNSMFWPCYWIIPWIHAFRTNCSGIQCWLAPPEYQSTHGKCCTVDHKTLWGLENQYCHEHQLVFWPFPVDQAMITHILAHYSSTEWWPIPLGHPFAHERCSTKDQKAPQHLENRLCHKGKSVF